MTFLYAEDTKYSFFYSDEEKYFELLKLIVGNAQDVRGILYNYQYDYSVEGELWRQLIKSIIKNKLKIPVII